MLKPDKHTMKEIKFKTADSLQLSEPQLSALKKVLRYLEQGKIPASTFSMDFWHSKGHRCGSTHCIGGWAEKLSGVTFEDHPPNLGKLFYPGTDVRNEKESDRAYRATRKEAAMALRNYLTFGKPRWRSVISAS